MSTSALRTLIQAGAAEVLPLDRIVREAKAELEAIEKAAVALHTCNATPYIASSEKGRLYYPAMKVIHAIAKESTP